MLLWHMLISKRFMQSFKSLAILIIGASFAFGSFPGIKVLILPYIVLTLLWGALYILNDHSDYSLDKINVKKFRPMLSLDKRDRRRCLYYAILMVVAMLILSGLINIYFLIFCLVMVTFQLMYIFRPFRLKERFLLDLIPVSVINPIMRFYAGWSLINFDFGFSWILVVLILLGLTTNLSNRLKNRDFEKKVGFRSLTVILSEKVSLVIIFTFGFLTFVLFSYLSLFSIELNPYMFLIPVLVFIFLFAYYLLRKIGLSPKLQLMIIRSGGFFVYFLCALIYAFFI